MDIHPIVAQMNPSAEQLPAVLGRGRDIVVTAGAGTGKTRTLVARYLSLLAEGCSPRAIIAITFTRKAAREMRNRVRKEVQAYLERDDLHAEEREIWQARYTTLDAARIGTIHSLCTEILHTHPVEAGVDPRFEVLEEGQTNILRSQAVDEALARAANDPDAVKLFPLLGERIVRDILAWLLAHWLEAEAWFERMPTDLIGFWRQMLEAMQAEGLEALLENFEWQDAVDILIEYEADIADDKMEVQRRDALAAIQGASGILSDRLSTLSRLGAISLSGGSGKAWPGGVEQKDQVKEALRALRTLWTEGGALLSLSLTEMDDALAGATPALRDAASFAAQRYAGLKGERNTLDFDDLETDALALLQKHAAARSHWQAQTEAILVDEFQDTNARQRDLVALLNGNRGRLFIVGDAKQSIYRFRGADVEVFRAERERIERERGDVHDLNTSYRAHAGLTEALNDLLRPVLGEEEDSGRPWLEPFAALRPHRSEPREGIASPFVELHLTVGSKGAGALDRAADALVGRIVELVGSSRLGYGDFAILCSASTSFAAYEDALEEAGIPFLTVAGRGFYGRPEIRDLLNGLQAIADPTDDLALVGLLRSPAMGLSDASLVQLCQTRDQAEGKPALWEILHEWSLSVPDGDLATRAAGLIEPLHQLVGRTAVADVLKAFLDATDYRAAWIRTGQARAARNVSKLLADAHASGMVGVGEFLEYVAGLRDSGAREGEARATVEGAVQIMSVHAAKGLEFPVVVIGDVARAGVNRASFLIDAKLGLLPVKDEEDQRPAAYEIGKAQSDARDAAESDRLLYVAATRAQEKLLINGCITLKKNGQVGKLGGWLGRLGGPECLALADTPITYDEEGAGVWQTTLGAGDSPVSCAIYEPGYQPALQPVEMPGAEEPITELASPLLEPILAEPEQVDAKLSERERIPAQRVWRVVPAVDRPSAPAWVIGSLVHEALAAWQVPGRDSLGAEMRAFERWCQARARSYGLADQRSLADAVTRSRRLLAEFRAHSLYAQMDGAERRLHEVPYSLIVDGKPQNGIIDSLYRRDGMWTVVEFKTDRIVGAAALDMLLEREDYVVQAERYRVAVDRLIGQQPAVVLCMLNYAGTVHLHQVR